MRGEEEVRNIEIDDILVMLRSAENGLAALKTLIDAIEAKLDVPDNFKADVSGLATSAALATHDTDIKADIAAISCASAAQLTTHDTDIKADIAASDAKIDTIDGIVDAIKAVTDIVYAKNDATPYYKTQPDLSSPVTLQSAANAWVYGSWVQMVGANEISTPFWLAGYLITHEEGLSVIAQFSIGIGANGSESEIINLPFRHVFVSAVGSEIKRAIFFTIPYALAANTRVAVCVSDNQATARTYGFVLVLATGL